MYFISLFVYAIVKQTIYLIFRACIKQITFLQIYALISRIDEWYRNDSLSFRSACLNEVVLGKKKDAYNRIETVSPLWKWSIFMYHIVYEIKPDHSHQMSVECEYVFFLKYICQYFKNSHIYRFRDLHLWLKIRD